MKWQTNDLVYDIEIRKNFFVISQYFPKQGKFIISYLDGMNQLTQHFNDLTDYQYGDLLSDYSFSPHTFFKLLQLIHHNDVNQTLQYFQQLMSNVNSQLIDQLINNGLSPINTKRVAKLTEYIDRENPSIVKINHNHYIFENLANPQDYANFAARFGLVNTKNIAYHGWTKEEHQTSIQEFSPNHGLFTSQNIAENAKTNSQILSDYYYPVKDIDQGYQSKNNIGLRIGYNSKSYDDTMIAHLLGNEIQGNLQNQTTLLNLLPSAFVYQHQPNQAYWQKANSIAPCLTNYQAYLLISLDQFYHSIEHLLPLHLTQFNQTLFNNQRYMPGALEYNSTAFLTKKAYENSNRFIDVMKQFPTAQPLKMVAGMFGIQIKESSTNEDPNQELTSFNDVADVIAYNVSDVFATCKIMELKGVTSTYQSRATLIKQNPQLTYQHDDSSNLKMKPQTNDPLSLRYDRITVNVTNPQIMQHIVAPYPNTKLVDDPVINFQYPHPSVAKKLGIKPFDALEDTKEWAVKHIGWKNFKPIYDYYNQFRGHNFNTEQNPAITHGYKIVSWKDDRMDPIPKNLEELKEHANLVKLTDNDDLILNSQTTIKHQSFDNLNQKLVKIKNVPGDYLNKTKDGRLMPSRGWYNASIGGLHGAEDKLDQYQKDLALQNNNYANAMTISQNAHLFTEQTPKELLSSMNTPVNHQMYQNLSRSIDEPLIFKLTSKERHRLNIKGQIPLRGIDLTPLKEIIAFHKNHSISPKLTEPITKWKSQGVIDKYQYTSYGPARHQDFSSYYPTLIVMLKVAVNADGIDEYESIYNDRLHNKKIAKTYQGKTPEETKRVRQIYKTKQAPQKLELNSFTGFADVKGHMRSKVRVSNKILKMRIIGQLFAWRIGQALALHGATIVSSNTDGLYTMGISREANDRIVKDQTDHLHLDVKPEEIDNFISKNANERLEYVNGKINEAKGSALTAWSGPN